MFGFLEFFFFLVIISPNVFILPPSDLLILMLKRQTGKNSPELLQCSVKRKQTNTFLCRLLIFSFNYCRNSLGYFSYVILNSIISYKIYPVSLNMMFSISPSMNNVQDHDINECIWLLCTTDRLLIVQSNFCEWYLLPIDLFAYIAGWIII